MNEVQQLQQQIAALQQRNRELEEELYRLTRKQFVSELRPGKALYWELVSAMRGE